MVQVGSPTQSAGRQSTGNTQVPPPAAVQAASLAQLTPLTEQVPSPHDAEVVQNDPSSAQCAKQSSSPKQLELEPMHLPGTHVPEAHPELDVHGAPAGARAVQTGVGLAAGSQNSSDWHCELNVHGAPAGSLG